MHKLIKESEIMKKSDEISVTSEKSEELIVDQVEVEVEVGKIKISSLPENEADNNDEMTKPVTPAPDIDEKAAPESKKPKKRNFLSNILSKEKQVVPDVSLLIKEIKEKERALKNEWEHMDNPLTALEKDEAASKEAFWKKFFVKEDENYDSDSTSSKGKRREILQQKVKPGFPSERTKGYFIPIKLTYADNDHKDGLSPQDEAVYLLDYISNLFERGISEVSLPLSANRENQTLRLLDLYQQDKRDTGIHGRGQAGVIEWMEKLLNTHKDYKKLKPRIKFLPITTCMAPKLPSGGKGKTREDWVSYDLKMIDQYILNGGTFIGLQTQIPGYAVGGGVAGDLDVNIDDMIQERFREFERKYYFNSSQLDESSSPTALLHRLINAFEGKDLRLSTWPLHHADLKKHADKLRTKRKMTDASFLLQGITSENINSALTREERKLLIVKMIANTLFATKMSKDQIDSLSQSEELMRLLKSTTISSKKKKESRLEKSDENGSLEDRSEDTLVEDAPLTFTRTVAEYDQLLADYLKHSGSKLTYQEKNPIKALRLRLTRCKSDEELREINESAHYYKVVNLQGKGGTHLFKIFEAMDYDVRHLNTEEPKKRKRDLSELEQEVISDINSILQESLKHLETGQHSASVNRLKNLVKNVDNLEELVFFLEMEKLIFETRFASKDLFKKVVKLCLDRVHEQVHVNIPISSKLRRFTFPFMRELLNYVSSHEGATAFVVQTVKDSKPDERMEMAGQFVYDLRTCQTREQLEKVIEKMVQFKRKIEIKGEKSTLCEIIEKLQKESNVFLSDNYAHLPSDKKSSDIREIWGKSFKGYDVSSKKIDSDSSDEEIEVSSSASHDSDNRIGVTSQTKPKFNDKAKDGLNDDKAAYPSKWLQLKVIYSDNSINELVMYLTEIKKIFKEVSLDRDEDPKNGMITALTNAWKRDRRIGGKLAALLINEVNKKGVSSIENLSACRLAELIQQTTIISPKIYTPYEESKYEWTSKEHHLLSKTLMVAKNVQVTDLGGCCDMVFVNLHNPFDREFFVNQIDQFDREKYKRYLIDRILPGLLSAADTAGGIIVPITAPEVNAKDASEASKIRKSFPEILKEIIQDNIQALIAIKAIIFIDESEKAPVNLKGDGFEIPFITTKEKNQFFPWSAVGKYHEKYDTKDTHELLGCAITAIIPSNPLDLGSPGSLQRAAVDCAYSKKMMQGSFPEKGKTQFTPIPDKDSGKDSKAVYSEFNIKITNVTLVGIPVSNTPLYKLGAKLLKSQRVRDNIAPECALVISLTKSLHEEEKKLGLTLMQGMTIQKIEEIRRKHPVSYHAQLLLIGLKNMDIKEDASCFKTASDLEGKLKKAVKDPEPDTQTDKDEFFESLNKILVMLQEEASQSQKPQQYTQKFFGIFRSSGEDKVLSDLIKLLQESINEMPQPKAGGSVDLHFGEDDLSFEKTFGSREEDDATSYSA